MGLFDDLLGGSKDTTKEVKTQQTTPVTNQVPTTQQTQDANVVPSVDPALVMNQEQTSTPAQAMDLLNMSAGNMSVSPSEEPTQNIAQTQQIVTPEAGESILVGEPTLAVQDSGVVDGGITIQNSEPLIEKDTMVSAKNNESPISESPITSIENTIVPSVDASQVKQESSNDILGMSATEMSSVQPKNDESSLLGLVSEQSEKKNQNEQQLNSDSTNTTANVDKILEGKTQKEEMQEELLSLFGNDDSNETHDESIDTNKSNVGFDLLEPTQKKQEELPMDTMSFIAMSLERLEKMGIVLDKKKQGFLNEAENFRSEKEKFARLEKEAVENSHSVDDEKARIESMRKYFENQQKKNTEGADISESVNTALTGESVKNAVTNTIKKPTTRKRTTTRSRTKKQAA